MRHQIIVNLLAQFSSMQHSFLATSEGRHMNQHAPQLMALHRFLDASRIYLELSRQKKVAPPDERRSSLRLLASHLNSLALTEN
jgi:hypothetical protein